MNVSKTRYLFYKQKLSHLLKNVLMNIENHYYTITFITWCRKWNWHFAISDCYQVFNGNKHFNVTTSRIFKPMRKRSRTNVSRQEPYPNKGNFPLFGWVILDKMPLTYKSLILPLSHSHFWVDGDAKYGLNFAGLRENGVLRKTKDGRRMWVQKRHSLHSLGRIYWLIFSRFLTGDKRLLMLLYNDSYFWFRG